MDSDRPMSSPSKEPRAARHGAGARKVCYIESAPQIDVLLEQLDYLLAHQRKSCPTGCVDCTRLNQVRNWLLLPFRVKARRQRSKRAAAA